MYLQPTVTTVLPRISDLFMSDQKRPALGITDVERQIEFEIAAEHRALKLATSQTERSVRLDMIQALNKRLSLCRKAIRGWDL